MPKKVNKTVHLPPPEPPPGSTMPSGFNCQFVRFWHRWGGHLDLTGGVACLTMLATIICYGWNFVHDTQAYGPKLKAQGQQIALVKVELDRIDGNIQNIMNTLNIPALKKTDTEIQLEHQQVEPDQ